MLPTGRAVAAGRTLASLSQSELAVLAGVGVTPLRLFETGKARPRVDTLERILSALSAKGVVFEVGDERFEVTIRLVRAAG